MGTTAILYVEPGAQKALLFSSYRRENHGPPRLEIDQSLGRSQHLRYPQSIVMGAVENPISLLIGLPHAHVIQMGGVDDGFVPQVWVTAAEKADNIPASGSTDPVGSNQAHWTHWLCLTPRLGELLHLFGIQTPGREQTL